MFIDVYEPSNYATFRYRLTATQINTNAAKPLAQTRADTEAKTEDQNKDQDEESETHEQDRTNDKLKQLLCAAEDAQAARAVFALPVLLADRELTRFTDLMPKWGDVKHPFGGTVREDQLETETQETETDKKERGGKQKTKKKRRHRDVNEEWGELQLLQGLSKVVRLTLWSACLHCVRLERSCTSRGVLAAVERAD